MNLYLKPLLFCLLVLATASCRDAGQGKTTTTDASKLSKSEQQFRSQFTLLTDSLDSNWQCMSESDERKMASIRRLLDEISYTPRYNTLRQRQLLSAHQRVKNMRYDRKTMAQSHLIDQYDIAQDSLVSGTLNLAAETPEVEKYPLISELSSDIQTEHSRVIIFRIRHDEVAREVNQILLQNPKAVRKLGEPFASMERVPLFTISGT